MSDPAPVSVVIPAYNAERFIEDAIRSVQAQTRAVSEIIVVVDACTDRTKQIAADLGAVVLEHQQRNMAAGLNLGINAATQPWIALLDADDFWKREKVAVQWEAIEACPDAAIVSCDLYTVNDSKTTTLPEQHLRERWNSVETIRINNDCFYFESVNGEFFANFFIATPTAMLRSDVFSNVGLFDESLIYGQTLEFFARVLARYPLAFVNKPLVYSRVHNANHTRNLEGTWNSYVSIVDRMLKNPDIYPKGAGEAHRERLKVRFLETERILSHRST